MGVLGIVTIFILALLDMLVTKGASASTSTAIMAISGLAMSAIGGTAWHEARAAEQLTAQAPGAKNEP